jgi:hypothetical protein
VSIGRSPKIRIALAIFAPKVSFDRRDKHMPETLIILYRDGLLSGVRPKLPYGPYASN